MSAVGAAAIGFDVCAARTRDATTAVAARSLAGLLRSLQRAVVTAARAAGIDARPKARTCDRLRWEWLASTGSVLDGAPERRLAGECVRVLSDASIGASLPERLRARLRSVIEEAQAIAFATEQMAVAFAG